MPTLPPQGPGAIQAAQSAYSAVVRSLSGGVVTFVIPEYDGNREHRTTAYVGTPTAGAQATVLFTDAAPLVIVHS